MRISYFRIRGYVNILNGMGLEELVIPFGEFKNRIILFQGANGCGKSTILNTLTPNPDSSDHFKTDVFIDQYGNRQIIEYPAEKEIHYVDTSEGELIVYKILIQSVVDESKTRRTTKAFISKNGEEMNPNGNVTSFKEIRDSLLGIDPIYLDLSSVSSENRGIVDMIPSERRKYMASYIGSLETYNNIFKTISKKVNNLKSYMNTLNSKIYEIGNEDELRVKQMQLESTLKDLNTSRDDILQKLSVARSTIQNIDPDNKMQDLYASIHERLENINFEIRRNKDSLDRIYRKLGISPENCNIEELIKENRDTLNTHESTVKSNTTEISTLVMLNETTINSIESDRSILSGLTNNTIQDNIIEAVDKLKQEENELSNYLSKHDIKILDTLSLDDLRDLRESLTNFLSEVASAEELYSHEDFVNGVSSITMDYEKLYMENVKIAQDKINQIKSMNNFKKDISFIEYISSLKCKDNCPIVKELSKGESNDQDIIDQEKYIESLSRSTTISRRIDKAISSFIISKKNTIKKIKELHFLLDIKVLIDRLISHNNFREFSIVDDLLEKSSIYKNLKEVQDKLNGLEGDLKTYMNNKNLIESLNESINKNEALCNERNEKIVRLNKDNKFLESLIGELSQKQSILDELSSELDKQSIVLNDKEQLKREFESVKDKIKLVKETLDIESSLEGDLKRIEETIKPLSEEINLIKFNLLNIIQYQQEYKESSDKYEKMNFIKNACSPGNGMGIQSEYIKRYMNDIIIDCNTMLGYMFGGMIQLDVPVINEKNFAIPFIGPGGIQVPDISKGSTAQKCMIGLVFSCVAMMKSSVKYNIPRFDEIDGGLYDQNRAMFITVLNQILDFMNSEQCIICSHNNEFDTMSTTRIICSYGGYTIEQ